MDGVEEEAKEYQDTVIREIEAEKTQKSKTKTGVVYSRSFAKWTPKQEQWLRNRKNKTSNVKLAAEFNKFFKRVKRSTSSISSKKIRIRKRK